MEKNKSNSDRDKMLEDILSMVDTGSKRKESSKAERAAASSANRTASVKDSDPLKMTSSYQRTSYGKTSAKNDKGYSNSTYGRSTGAKKNPSADRTESVRRTGSVSRGNAFADRTGSVSRANTSADRTGSVSRGNASTDRTGSVSRANTSADRTGSVNRANASTDRTGSVNRGNAFADRTGSVSRANAFADRTGSVGRASSAKGIISNTGVTDRHRYDDEYEHTSSIRSVRTSAPDSDEENRGGVRKKRRKISGRLPMVLIVTTIIFTVAISLSILIISVGRDMLAIGKSDDIKIITIPEGSNTEEVAQILSDEGIIKMPKAFIFISKLGGSDTKYIAGDHELSPSNAYETIISELTTDKSLEQESVDVTFIEGCDIISIGKQLEEAGVCEAERFIYYFNAGDYGFEFEKYLPASTSSKFNRMEGYLFPDTYTFYVDTDPEVVCQKIYKNFDEKFKPEYYAQMKKMNMTLDEVIILASIVQAESPNVKTMKNVASIFENRLASPEEYPKLQSDPTTYYVDEVIKPNIEIPSEAIFEAYDTYQCNGLPPGAIGNPGVDAIEAVLYPADTDYYYFYANIETSETFYAETNEEHEANKEMVKEQQLADEEDGEE